MRTSRELFTAPFCRSASDLRAVALATTAAMKWAVAEAALVSASVDAAEASTEVWEANSRSNIVFAAAAAAAAADDDDDNVGRLRAAAAWSPFPGRRRRGRRRG